MKLKVKYDKNHPRIKKIKVGDWYDLSTSEEVKLKIGEFKLIPLGVRIEVPEGYEAHLAPRSSTYAKWGIIQTNSVGVIDNSYSGNDDEWKMPALYIPHIGVSEHFVNIPKGTRIAQFRIMPKQPALTFEEVDNMDNESRGGFGSTGER